MSKQELKRKDIIEPELSYKMVGILYRVFNELGPGLQEKYYQKAVSEALRQEKISFKEQVAIPLKFSDKIIGRYFADFIIENKIVLELKKGVRINRMQANQVIAYLKTTKLSLGLLAYFGNDGVFCKRIVNINS